MIRPTFECSYGVWTLDRAFIFCTLFAKYLNFHHGDVYEVVPMYSDREQEDLSIQYIALCEDVINILEAQNER